jgi:selenocysteine-specific elongation factor
MKRFIIGTAGHIDHGKTALIKAITQIDCDTHPQEKRRGITINPGFAYLREGKQQLLAFIDVPGHQKFIHNMIAGAFGVDFMMLVVAADDGVMPQTIEHLKICSLLGIQSGITVINKCDSVTPDMLELCKEEVLRFLKGTILEGKPLFCVSALKGDGINELKEYLLKGDFDVTLKEGRDLFRLYVDRIFQVAGFGSIATGTSLGGEVRVGDNLYLLPLERRAKVRHIQQHEESVTSCVQGNRIALNLSGIKREEVEIGDIVSEYLLPKTERIDAQIICIDDHYGTLDSFEALLFVGTKRVHVRAKAIHTYSRGDERATIVQLALSYPWYFTVNERFILRNTSNDKTIAGGFVIDPLPLVHKKVTSKLINSILPIVHHHTEYIRYKVEESLYLLDCSYFCPLLQLTETTILELVRQSDVLRYVDEGNTHYLFPQKRVERFTRTLLEGMAQFHSKNPLSSSGVEREQIRSLLKSNPLYRDRKSNELAIQLLLSQLEREEVVVRRHSRWSMAGHKPAISATHQKWIDATQEMVYQGGVEGIFVVDIGEKYREEGADSKLFEEILNHLEETKILYRNGEKAFHAQALSEVKKRIFAHIECHPKGIRVSEVRELLGTNRKVAMSYLEILEKERYLFREGELRFLT